MNEEGALNMQAQPSTRPLLPRLCLVSVPNAIRDYITRPLLTIIALSRDPAITSSCMDLVVLY